MKWINILEKILKMKKGFNIYGTSQNKQTIILSVFQKNKWEGKDLESLLNEIMAESYPDPVQGLNTHIQEA